jgi:hypothetical protein
MKKNNLQVSNEEDRSKHTIHKHMDNKNALIAEKYSVLKS